MSGSFVVSTIAAVTLTTALSLAASRVARQSRAAFRHVLLLAGFAVLLLLPMTSTVAPSIEVTVPIEDAPVVLAPAAELFADLVSPGPAAATPADAVPASTGASQLPALATMLAIAWLAGASLFGLPLIVGLWQVRRLHQSGLPWPEGDAVVARLSRELQIRRPVSVLLHEAAAGPLTFGLRRSTILLPIDASEWPAEDLERAIVHELAHVRRRDWLSQCAARLISAVYWFHPLVWVARRQLALEAERACDDVVLQRAEAAGYADQLVGLARRLSSAHHQPLLAMASRHDLATRIRALLDSGQARGRAGSVVIVVACLASAALVLAMSPLRLVAQLTGQAKATVNWEVASIKPCDPSAPRPGGGGRGGRSGGGGVRMFDVTSDRLVVNCMTVLDMVNLAYSQYGDPPPINHPQGFEEEEIKGTPAWARSERYSIDAKAEREVSRTEILGAMLRALLEDRFQLKIHQEVTSVQGFALKIADGGLKIKPVDPDSCIKPDPSHPVPRVGRMSPSGVFGSYEKDAPADAKPFCGSGIGFQKDRAGLTYDVNGQRPDQIANALTAFVMDRPVLDETGVNGTFSFHLEYAPDANTRTLPMPPGVGWPESGGGPNIFAVLEKQIGFKLMPAKTPLGSLVIDRLERPSDGSPQTTPAKFDAATIKPCETDEPPRPAGGGARSSQGGFPTVSPGRFTIECGTVERLISNAYVLHGERLENNIARIGDVSWWKGGPEWIRYDKYTVEAVAAGVTDREVLLGPMLRALLEDRFKLKLHRETQDVPMYNMTIAKGGLKIQPMPPGGCVDVTSAGMPADPRAQAAAVLAGTAPPNCNGMTMMGSPGHSRWVIGGTSMTNFAGTLTTSMDHYVVDKTGISPDIKYNIHLEFAADEHMPGADKRNPRTEFAPADAPLIFAALEQQLGIKLEATKGPQGVLVIDRIERPSPDFAKASSGRPVPPRAKGPGR